MTFNAEFNTYTQVQPPLCWCLVDGEEDCCLKDSGSLVPAGTKTPARSNQAWPISKEGPDKTQHLVLYVKGGANIPTA